MLATIIRVHKEAIFVRGFQYPVAMLACTPGLEGVQLLASVAQDAFPDHTPGAKLAMFIGTPGGLSCRL